MQINNFYDSISRYGNGDGDGDGNGDGIYIVYE